VGIFVIDVFGCGFLEEGMMVYDGFLVIIK
jgi:hypothetical protein